MGEGRHVRERSGMLPQEREVRSREHVSGVGVVRFLLIEADQLTGLLVGQRGQQHGLDHAEHGRRAADAEGEGRRHDAGEARAAPQLP